MFSYLVTWPKKESKRPKKNALDLCFCCCLLCILVGAAAAAPKQQIHAIMLQICFSIHSLHQPKKYNEKTTYRLNAETNKNVIHVYLIVWLFFSFTSRIIKNVHQACVCVYE